MLLKHTSIYFIARALPGVISFSSLIIYTRLLSPESYGVYILVVSTAGLVWVILFSWLELALLRILPSHLEDPGPLLSTVLGLFLGLALLTGAAGGLAAALQTDPVMRELIILGLPILWANAWLELNLKLCQSKLMPGLYGRLLLIRAFVTLSTSVALVLHGLEANGLMVGVLVGNACASMTSVMQVWRGVRPKLDRLLIGALAGYGIPLTGVIAMSYVVDATDRFMIAAFLDTESVGAYSAAYNIASHPILFLMSSVGLAAYPLAIRAFERGGAAAALVEARQAGSYLLGVSIPATVGIVILAPQIAEVLLGANYRAPAPAMIPWVSAGLFVSGLKAFLFDWAFQLQKRSAMMMWSVTAASIANVVLNYWLIPRHGTVGAAWATLASYLIALAVSVLLGRRLLAISLDWGQVARIMFASAVMGLVLLWLEPPRTAFGLAGGIAVGIATFGACALFVNVLGVRRFAVSRLYKLPASQSRQ